MELFYSLDFYRSPHVAIIPNPDAYDEVKGHIIPVQEGIRMWQSDMEGRYGGDWDVTFEVVEPGTFFDSMPDVIMNIDTYETHAPCYADYAGVAWPSTERPVQTIVCSSDGQRRSNTEVAATAAHEFIHAVGLGHAFNKTGDMMCSVEDGVPTCDQVSFKLDMPSDLNLAGVAAIYGADGFKNPNRYVEYKERFPSGGVDDSSSHAQPECLSDEYEWDISESLESGEYVWFPVCGDGPRYYSFFTEHEYDTYVIYVLPPETDVIEFMDGEVESYDMCGDGGGVYHDHYNTCDIESGSNIVLYNTTGHAITIYGYVASHE